MLDFAEELDDPRFSFDVVWVPIYPGYEDISDALDNTPVSPSPSARVWYDADLVLPEGLAEVYDLSLAWDIYMVYEPGREWLDPGPEGLGMADFWMHQLRDGPSELRLDPATFEAALRERRPQCLPWVNG
jgi:hypothetical protein